MKYKHKIYIFAIAVAIVINVFSWHLPFFWDTILTSTITQYFFEQGFQNFITPAQFDAGHPPLFYIYVTTFYFIFGKGLLAAHLAMLPFTIIGILSFIQLLQYFNFDKKQQYLGLILFFSIPAVITQFSLVSYDAVLLSLYLLVLVLIFKNKKILSSLVLILIVGISLRGLFCLISLSITIYFLEKRNLNSWFKWNMYFIPSILIVAFWFYYHYSQTGWFISTNAEGWSQHRGLVGLYGLFKNTISIVRSFFDLGIIIIALLSLFYLIEKRKVDQYTLLWLIPFLVFSISFLPFTNPINHRYFLIVFVLMLLPVIKFLSLRKNIFAVLTTIILLLGHFLIYPIPISNGWDCTLVHTKYSSEIKIIHDSIDSSLLIDKTKIGTVFPIIASRKQTEMSEDTVRMYNVNGISLDTIEFILFSNIGNDFSKEQIIEIRKWRPLIVNKKNQIEIILYRNPIFF